jgi:hypothetical protein
LVSPSLGSNPSAPVNLKTGIIACLLKYLIAFLRCVSMHLIL